MTLAATAKAMQRELNATRLTVILVGDMRGDGCVRLVTEQNPEWYRVFCAAYSSARRDLGRWRKHKTKIKRQSTLRALGLIAKGETAGVYVGRLLPVVQDVQRQDEVEERHAAAAKVRVRVWR